MNTLFIKSFSCFKTSNITSFIFLMLFDLCFYLIFAGAIVSFIWYVIPKAYFLSHAKGFVESMQNMPMEQLAAMASYISSSIYMFIGWSLLLVLILLAGYSFFKGMIWSRTMQKTYTWRTFLRLCLFNFMSGMFLILMLFFAAYFISDANQVTFMLLVAMPLTFHFITVSNALAISENIKSFWFRFLKVAFGRIYLFLIPYLILFAVLVILINIMILIQFLPAKPYFLIYLLVFVAYSCWAKNYLNLIIKTINT